MTDLIVSRVQNRRGKLIDLPQPLAEGELGWATDVNRLFIGGKPDEVPAGVQVYLGNILLAQNYLNTRILRFDASTLTIFNNITTALVNLSSPNTINAGFTYYASTKGYVILTPTQALDYSVIENEILLNGGTNVVTCSNYIIDINTGAFATSDHETANVLARALTDVGIYDVGVDFAPAIATTKLNVEILTEFSVISGGGGGPAPIFIETTLTPSATFIDVPGYVFDPSINDAIDMKYSLNTFVSTSRFSAVGNLKIIASQTQSNASLDDDRTVLQNYTDPTHVFYFKATYSASTLKLQYRSTYPNPVVLKTTHISWFSFGA